jgi:hypothetical protein
MQDHVGLAIILQKRSQCAEIVEKVIDLVMGATSF